MLTLLHLFSALALLVWGTHIVRRDMLRLYGVQLRLLLSRSTRQRLLAFVAGLGVTSMIQSSNATAVIVCSFVSRGLVALSPALAIMLGADVGTALMTGVLSFDVSWLSPLLIFLGVVVFLTSAKDSNTGRIGRVGIGLGLILLALHLIAEVTHPMTEVPGVRVMFATLGNDLMLAVLVGALFSMISYSSLAAVLLAGTLASTGMLAMPVAICLAIGANLGSGVIAVIGASNQNAAARRVALGSMLFRLLGAGLVLPLLGPIDRWLAGLPLTPLQCVVSFHIAYSLLRSLLCLPLVGPMAAICTRLLPDRGNADAGMRARHLDEAAIQMPSLALANAAREVLRIGEIIDDMLAALLAVIRDNDLEKVREVRRLDHDVDKLYTAVKMYLARVSREELDAVQVRRWTDIITLTINLEQAGDIIERIVEDVQDKKIMPRRTFSDAGMQEVTRMHERLVASLRLGLSVFLNGDVKSAQRLLEEKDAFRDLERASARTHLLRLAGQTTESIETSSLHLDIISDMKRLHSLFCSTAYSVLDEAGLLRHSRLNVEKAGQLPSRAPIESRVEGREYPG